MAKNIYKIGKELFITNDEEIKDGDFCFHFNHKSIMKIGVGEGKLMKGHTYLKKIILTTDLELQKDGVQPIDDEFLEWFVQNPSCEEIELMSLREIGRNEYEIIIPEEETTLKLPSLPYEYEPLINKNQETLEEAAQNYADIHMEKFDIVSSDKLPYFHNDRHKIEESFEAGFKLAQERSYSEEDLIDAFNEGQALNIRGRLIQGKEWFKQFKKQIK